jgi:Zn-dependent peptidase ImmA (M78 family)
MDNCTEDKKFIDMLQYTNKTPKDNKVKTIYDVYTSYKKNLEDSFPYQEFSTNFNQKVTPNPFNLKDFANDIGILIKEDILDINISGQLKGNTITVNVKNVEKRRNFTIAHEIGHYILHFVDGSITTEYRSGEDIYYNEAQLQQEKEADCFAANLLLPSNVIKKIVDKFKDSKNIQSLTDDLDSTKILIHKFSNVFNVSTSEIIKRLQTLQYLYSWIIV